jgi:tRNA dimethylallyltransferase
MPNTPIKTSWFLTGPTASGKSALGVELALRLGAEIVSMDSMALYRRMDIGTAKPTADERAAVPHHLIDVIEPWEEYSLAQYLEAAEKCAAEISNRNKKVLFVGGTPLYLKGLLRGIFEGPKADDEFRRNLLDEAARNDPDWLHEELKKVDSASAARLHANDARRLIRALEVFHFTGRPISELQQQFEIGRPSNECKVFVLDWPKTELHERIEKRVDAMFEQGLGEEVRALVGQVSNLSKEPRQIGNPPHLSKTAQQAVGYREVLEHLEGRHSLDETIELVKIHTRQLAKRQNTWFRSLSECRFVSAAGLANAPAFIEDIINLGNQ